MQLELDSYASVFNVFIERFDGYPVIEAWFRSFLQSLPQPPTAVLSVGAGDGHYDEAILRHLLGTGVTPTYWALEPNPEVIDALRERLARTHDATSVFCGGFDDRVELPAALERGFDLILMTHCVYFMQRPAQALHRARRLLRPGGHILVHHQGESVISALFRELGRSEVPPGAAGPDGWGHGRTRQDHSMTLATLSEALKAAGIPHFVDEQPASVFVDEFFDDPARNPGSRQIVLAMLSFFLDLPVNMWPPERRELAIAFVRERSARSPASGRYAFPHPEGLLVIPHPDATWAPPGMRCC